MRMLLRILPFVFLIWLIGNFLYSGSAGRKRGRGNKKHNSQYPPAGRKRVESKVIENDSK